MDHEQKNKNFCPVFFVQALVMSTSLSGCQFLLGVFVADLPISFVAFGIWNMSGPNVNPTWKLSGPMSLRSIHIGLGVW